MAEDKGSPKTDTRAASPSDFGRNDSRLLQSDKDAEALSKRPDDALQAEDNAPLDRSNSDFANIHYGAPADVDPLTPENAGEAEEGAELAAQDRLDLEALELDPAQSGNLPDGTLSPIGPSSSPVADALSPADAGTERPDTANARPVTTPLPGDADAPPAVVQTSFVTPEATDTVSRDALPGDQDLAARDVPVDSLGAPATIPFDVISGDLQETVRSGGTISSAYDPSGLSVAQMRSGQPGVSYTLVDAAGNPIDHPLFEVIGSGIYVKLGVEIDYETNPSIDVFVQARDGSGHTTTQSLTIDVTDFEGLGIGTSGNDRIRGTSEEDVLIGGDGNDRLYGNGGSDSFDGGAGNDILYVDADDVSVQGGDGTDRVIVQGSDGVSLDLTAGSIERADGGAGDDVFDATGSADRVRLYGNDGDDTLTGGDGNDIIRGGDGSDTLVGGAGNDQLRGDAGADILDGGEGNDTLYIDADDTSIQGGDGTDRAIVQGTDGVTLDLTASSIERADGGAGDDVFDATGSADRVRLYGNDGDDSLTGGDGNDIIRGGDGSDTLMGGAGNDQLRGDAGADILDGGEGNDTLYIDADDTSIQGGDGTDRAIVQGTDGVTLDLTASSIERADGGAGDDVFDATGSADRVRLYGNDGDDTLTGGDGNDIIRGGDGADILRGGAGNDTLRGDAGNDRIYVGTGNDRIIGGDGDDTVVFSGSRADYLVTELTGGQFRITDLRVGAPDGINRISEVEHFEFSDGIIDVDDILNAPPSAIQLVGGDIMENAVAGSVVGTLNTIDPDSPETFTYQFVDIAGDPMDHPMFEIVGGEIRVKAGVDLSFEDQAVFDFDIEVTDSVGNTYVQGLSVNVLDENEAPTAVRLENVVSELSEGADTTAAIKIADIVVSDDALGTNNLTLTGADADNFEIVGNELYLKAGASLDFELQSSLDVTVEIDDASVGGTPDASEGLTLSVLDANEAPTGIRLDLALTEFPENLNTLTRTKVADIIVDDDALGSFNLSLNGLDAASFEIEGNELYLKAGVNLNFAIKPTFDVSVQVDDPTVGGTPDASVSLSFDVLEINDGPSAVTLSNVVTNLDEDTDTSSRIKIADIDVTDDGLGTNNLTLSGSDAEHFEIIGNELFLKAGTDLDFETHPTFDVTVEADDPDTPDDPDATISTSLNLVDVNEAPTDIVVDKLRQGVALNEDGGNNAYLRAENSDFLVDQDTFTFEISFAGDQQGTNFTPLASYAAPGSHNEFLIGGHPSDGHLSVFFRGQKVETTIDLDDLFDGEAHHLAVTRDSSDGSLEVYVDGVLEWQASNIQTGANLRGDGSLVFGQEQDSVDGSFSTAQVFQGALLDVAVYDDVRTADEVASDAGGGTGDGLIVNWDLSGFSGGTALSGDGTNALVENTVSGSGFYGGTGSSVTDLGLPETISPGTVVATLSAVDEDTLDTATFEIVGGSSQFEIVGNEIRVKAGASFDYETTPVETLDIRVTDNAGNTFTETVSFDISDVNEAPTAVTLENVVTDLGEDADTSSRIKIADISVSDDALGTNSLTLTGADADSFEIIGNELFLKAGTALDFESKTAFDVTVQVDDASLGGAPDATASLSVGVTDASEDLVLGDGGVSFTDTEAQETSVTGGAGDDTITGTSGNDVLSGGAGADLLEGGDGNDTFTLNGADGTWSGYAAQHTETGERVSLSGLQQNEDVIRGGDGTDTVVATDSADALFLDDGISPQNADAPGARFDSIERFELGGGDDVFDFTSRTYTYDTDTTVDGGAGDDTIWAADGDDTLIGGAGSDSIHGGAGTDTAVFTGNVSDYTITQLDTSQYQVVDNRAGSPDGTDVVTDVEFLQFADGTFSSTDFDNQAPTSVTLSNVVSSFAEDTDTSSRLKVADIAVGDDGQGTNVLSLTGADAGSFEIIGNELYLKAGTSLDFESKTSFDVTVQVDDASVGGAPDATASLSVDVTDVNEAPTAISLSSTRFDEGVYDRTDVVVGDLNTTDPDSGETFSYQIVSDPSGLAFIEDGQLKFADGTYDFETQDSYDITVRATDSAGNVVDQDFTIQVNDVNEAPTAVTLSNVVTDLSEDTDMSSRVKVADISVSDDALGTNDLTLSGADAGSFEIIGNELYLKAGTSLDFESKTAFDVTIQVDDASVGGAPDATASLSLGVTDANDAPTDIVFHQAYGTQDAGATYTDTGVKIDGISDDAWSGAASYSLSNTVSGSVTDATDLSGSFGVMWDADKIYFRARIVDDKVVGDEGGANWQDDSVEFYLDVGNDQTGTYDATDFQFVVGQGADNIDLHRSGKLVSSSPTGTESATELTADGYTAEFSVTWESLGLKAPTENMDIGFGFAVNDDDDGGDRDGQMMWDTKSGDLWQDTSQFGNLTLEPVAPALAVAEESAGATIGSLSVIDSDAVDSFSFAVSDSRFEVVDNDGTYDLKLKDGVSLDYEVDGDHVDLAVTVTDKSGGSYTEKFSVAVEDVDDTINGTSGNDTITGDASDNTIYALDGDDTINAGAGDDIVYMGAGDDTFDTTVGDADSGDGIDTVFGEGGQDTIWGGGSGDTLDGGADADYINGEAGDDIIIGGLGDDNLYGDSGDDLFIFHEGDGNDTISGGSGWTDTIELFNADASGAPDSAWTIELDGGRSATFSSADGYLDLGSDASGTITFDNGDVIDFSGIERIEW